MKTRLLSAFLTLILFSTVLLSNTFAQDYTQWELPEGATARLGKGGINEIQYSPDNRFLAVASTIGIWIYDTVTLQEARPLRRKYEWDFLRVAESGWSDFCGWQRRDSSTLGYHHWRASGNTRWAYGWDIRHSVQFRWTDYRNWQQ